MRHSGNLYLCLGSHGSSLGNLPGPLLHALQIRHGGVADLYLNLGKIGHGVDCRPPSQHNIAHPAGILEVIAHEPKPCLQHGHRIHCAAPSIRRNTRVGGFAVKFHIHLDQSQRGRLQLGQCAAVHHEGHINMVKPAVGGHLVFASVQRLLAGRPDHMDLKGLVRRLQHSPQGHCRADHGRGLHMVGAAMSLAPQRIIFP